MSVDSDHTMHHDPNIFTVSTRNRFNSLLRQTFIFPYKHTHNRSKTIITILSFNAVPDKTLHRS